MFHFHPKQRSLFFYHEIYFNQTAWTGGFNGGNFATWIWNWKSFFLVEYIDCLLYTSDAADDASSVDLGGRRIIKKTFFQAEDGIRD